MEITFKDGVSEEKQAEVTAYIRAVMKVQMKQLEAAVKKRYPEQVA